MQWRKVVESGITKRIHSVSNSLKHGSVLMVLVNATLPPHNKATCSPFSSSLPAAGAPSPPRQFGCCSLAKFSRRKAECRNKRGNTRSTVSLSDRSPTNTTPSQGLWQWRTAIDTSFSPPPPPPPLLLHHYSLTLLVSLTLSRRVLLMVRYV